MAERTLRHVSWKQRQLSGTWSQAALTLDCLAIETMDAIDPHHPVRLRLMLETGAYIETTGLLTSRLDESPPLLLFTLALTPQDTELLSQTTPVPALAQPLKAGGTPQSRAAIVVLVLICVGLVAAIAALAVA